MSESLVAMLERQEREAAAALTPDALDYIATGGGEEISLREAAAAWRAHRLLPHVLRDVSDVHTDTDVLGLRLRAPVMVASTAGHGLAHAEGELETARGLSGTGIPLVVATRASRRIEDIAAALDAPWWFQVYVVRDRGLTRELVQRAAAAGARALALTGDTPVLGRKPRQGFPPFTDAMLFANFAEHIDAGVEGAARYRAIEQDPSITLDTIAWLNESSGLPVLVKGVLRADDARACVDAGAAGIIVSNHGARQLDRTLAPAAALPAVVDAVGDTVPVLVDGGIRTGLDVLVALALGARAALVGRPVLWALACEGAAGVRAYVEDVVDDLRHAMALAGVREVSEVTRDLIA